MGESPKSARLRQLTTLSDDPLAVVRFFTVTVFNNKIYKYARIFSLVCQLLLSLVSVYFFVSVSEADFIFTFLATFLSIIAVRVVSS